MALARGYLDSVLGIEEGGSSGVQMLAALKTAGISTAGMAPWVLGGNIGLNLLGKYLSSDADARAEGQQLRLGDQNIEMNALTIEAEKAKREQEKKRERKNKALQSALSGVFSEYSRIKGGG